MLMNEFCESDSDQETFAHRPTIAPTPSLRNVCGTLPQTPLTRDREVGKPSNRAVPVTSSFGGLDIRHRLPTAKA
jgi:hypothetical protein